MIIDLYNFTIDIWFCGTKLSIRAIRICYPSHFPLDLGGIFEQHSRIYKLIFDLG